MYCGTMSSGFSFGNLLKTLLALVILAIIVYVIVDSSHAVLRHGDDAIEVRNCVNDPNKILGTFPHPDGKTAFICLISGTKEDGRFGVRIMSDTSGDEITAFIKNKMRTIDQVLTYLKNGGYLIH